MIRPGVRSAAPGRKDTERQVANAHAASAARSACARSLSETVVTLVVSIGSTLLFARYLEPGMKKPWRRDLPGFGRTHERPRLSHIERRYMKMEYDS